MSNEDLTGSAAPPMANGELVFDAPWQGRVFGMAKTLADNGAIAWDDFRAELIAQIARSEEEEPFDYYRCFQAALESVLAKQALIDNAELEHTVSELAARPHGHDHG